MDVYRTKGELGATIARLRTERHWDQPRLAELLQIDQPSVSRLERGQRGLTAFELHRIAVEFGVSPDEILMRQAVSPAMLRVGVASEDAVTRGLELFEHAVATYFSAEALARLL